MICAFNISDSLRDTITGNAVPTGTIEARRIHRSSIHLGVAHDLHTDDTIASHGNLAVVELKVLEIVEAVLGKLSAGHQPVVRQNLYRSDVTRPQGQVPRGVIRRTGKPVQIEVRVDVRLFQNVKHILLDVGRKFRAVEQFLARPQCPSEHASSSLCIRAVRRISEIERADCAKYGVNICVEARLILTPNESGSTHDIRTSKHGIRIHGEILEKISKGPREAAFGTLVLDKQHHLISRLLGLLFLPALHDCLGHADNIDHGLPSSKSTRKETLLQRSKNLVFRLGRNIRTGRR